MLDTKEMKPLKEWIGQIQKISLPLKSPASLDALIDDIGESKYVLLGEATHGTSEFYVLRTEISKKLIERKGFSFIAVEGDWPACYEVNRYVKQYPDSRKDIEDVLQAFKRWPSWMWANQETKALAEWMKETNRQRVEQARVGFYGLDVYSLWESLEAIMEYLKRADSVDYELAKKAFMCFEPYRRDSQSYGISAAFLHDRCEDEVIALLQRLQDNKRHVKQDRESSLSAELNALVTVNAEKYYRAMVKGGPDSWNIRDQHMVDALHRLMQFHGSEAKAIIWEHNTHIGDARATNMKDEGMVNVGQILRETSNEVYAVGFGTYEGTVIAAKGWGEAVETIRIPPAEQGSWEHLLHQAGVEDKLLLLNHNKSLFQQAIGHRAIGVVYHPQFEHLGNYVPTVIPKRYDAFIYVDHSHALHPLQLEPVYV